MTSTTTTAAALLASVLLLAPVQALADEPAPAVQAERAAAPGPGLSPPPLELRGWFLEPPFQRVLDLQIGLAGWPGLWGLCAEANPRWYLSFEACWDSNGNVLSDYDDLSLSAKSRALGWLGLTRDGESVRGDQVGLGPTVAYRYQREVTYHPSSGPESATSSALDAGLSLEWVHWFSRYFGITMQWEAGPEVLFREGEAWPTFFVRYTVGAAF